VGLVGVLVDTVVRYQFGDGSSVLVEVDEAEYRGLERMVVRVIWI